ncbi:hypothetical protein BGZ65_001825 [Modicella reniformis]|uniref:Uncharacterized protein n=1 Tax=Modicella reniformis TaxID=1440133 RepID=A0A9P6J1K8_9FUNG|nr:hypothetical protein BGZ65_001825 [Modicella reniformis]
MLRQNKKDDITEGKKSVDDLEACTMCEDPRKSELDQQFRYLKESMQNRPLMSRTFYGVKAEMPLPTGTSGARAADRTRRTGSSPSCGFRYVPATVLCNKRHVAKVVQFKV